MKKTHSVFNRVDALLQSVKEKRCVSGSLEKDWNFYFSNIDYSTRDIIELLKW